MKGENVMATFFGFHWFKLLSRSNHRNQLKARTTQRSFRPGLDVLEDRFVPSLMAVDHGLLVYDNDAVDLRADGSTGATGVYWLANANLAATETFGVQGINPDGSMTWQTALDWVAAMNNVDNGPGQPTGYLGYSNWTLPLTPDVDPNHTATQTNPNTGESFGFNFYSSLFGHLFYSEFGAHAGDNIIDMNNTATRQFDHFQPYYYWGGDFPGNHRAFHLPVDFSFGSGFLGTDLPKDFEYVIPEFSIDSTDRPVAPPANVTVPLMPVQVNPSLVQIPDHKTVYDAALNITWLADANLAATNTFGVQGINADGSMSYEAATDWIEAMNNANYLGHSNWHLPNAQVSDQDYYKTDNDLGELYYTELGGQAGSTILLTHDRYEHLFQHFQPYYYWTGTEANGKTDAHETFSFGSGFRSGNTDPNEMYVIPVFDNPVGYAASMKVHDTLTNMSWLAGANLAATVNSGAEDVNPEGSIPSKGRYAILLDSASQDTSSLNKMALNHQKAPDRFSRIETALHSNVSEERLTIKELMKELEATILNTPEAIPSN
jgi:hypothetical protein